jgi:hypothetical protein
VSDIGGPIGGIEPGATDTPGPLWKVLGTGGVGIGCVCMDGLPTGPGAIIIGPTGGIVFGIPGACCIGIGDV